MINLLKNICNRKIPSCIYTNFNNTDKFHFGYVLAVNDQNIAIHMISPDGEDDGIIVMNTENIIRVDTENFYSKKMIKLSSDKNIFSFDIHFENDEILYSVLCYAFQKKYVVTIELCNSGYNDITGLIENIEDKTVKIKLFDEYGSFDGYSYVSSNDISILSLLSQDEKRLTRLIS